LRTTFGGINDAPGLRITAPGKIGEVLTVEPIGDGGRVGGKRLKALQLKKIKLLAEQEAWEPLDMTRAPLLRARLLRMQTDDHVLLLTFHHAVADGWSIGIVFDEISRRYAALVGRPTEPLQKLPLSFADVARWQRWWCGTEAAKRRAAEWTDALRGATPVFTSKDGAETIPAGRPTGYHPLRLNGELIAEISTFASSQNGTLFMALMTALKAVLALRTGRNDICVATSMANRTQPDTDRVIGPFENTVIVRTRIEPELSFAQAFARVRESVLEAHARQELPFELLVDRLEEAGIDPAAVTQVSLTLQNPLRRPIDLPDIAVRSIGNVAREGQPVLPVDQTWLSLMLKERPIEITGSCNYKRELLGNTTISAWMNEFISFLASGAAQPDMPLARLLKLKAA
jgi:hypothetical protein